MTTIDLFWAIVAGNIVSMGIIGVVNYLLDRYYTAKRRERLDEILSKIDIDFVEPSKAKASTKKTVKKQAPKKNG